MNLRALLNSRRIVIFLLGEAKLRTYAAACGPGPVEEMPVRAVLRADNACPSRLFGRLEAQNLSPTSSAAMRGVPRITVSNPTVAPRPTPPTAYCLLSIFLT